MSADVEEVEVTEEAVNPVDSIMDGIGESLNSINEQENEDVTEDDSGEENEETVSVEESADEEADDNSGEDDSEEVKEVEEESASPGISKNAIYVAAQAGLSMEDAESFGSDEALFSALKLIESKTQKPEEEVEEEAEVKQEGVDLLDLGIAEEVDEEFGGAFTKMNVEIVTLKQSQKSLMEEQKVLIEALQNERTMRTNSAFDVAASGLGGLESLLGKGTLKDVEAEQQESRKKLHAQFSQLNDLDRQKGTNTPIEKQVQNAANIVFAEQSKQVARKELAKKVGSRTKISRPSGSRDTGKNKPSTRDAIMANIDNQINGR